MPPEFDRFAGDYDAHLGRALGGRLDADRFAAYKVDEVAERLRAVPVRRVLDFGCGVGRGLGFLADAFPGAELWGFDPSAPSLEEAQRRAPGARLTADWAALPGGFDCILAANVLHHVAQGERAATLARCRDALAPGGSLFVFEHNPLNPLTRLVFERCPFDEGAAMIRRGHLVAEGERAGLRQVRSGFTLFLPFRGRLARRVHRALSWLPLGAQYCVQFAR